MARHKETQLIFRSCRNIERRASTSVWKVNVWSQRHTHTQQNIRMPFGQPLGWSLGLDLVGRCKSCCAITWMTTNVDFMFNNSMVKFFSTFDFFISVSVTSHFVPNSSPFIDWLSIRFDAVPSFSSFFALFDLLLLQLQIRNIIKLYSTLFFNHHQFYVYVHVRVKTLRFSNATIVKWNKTLHESYSIPRFSNLNNKITRQMMYKIDLWSNQNHFNVFHSVQASVDRRQSKRMSQLRWKDFFYNRVCGDGLR